MILSRIFGRRKKSVKGGAEARREERAPQKEKKTVEKTVPRKKKVRRIVHTERAFHKKKGIPAKERVNIYEVIDRPALTEKAARMSEKGVYVFLVRPSATKHAVMDAVEAVYSVRPEKVRMAKNAPKRKRIRIPGREREYGLTAGKKKAYVFLRKGDTIRLM